MTKIQPGIPGLFTNSDRRMQQRQNGSSERPSAVPRATSDCDRSPAIELANSEQNQSSLTKGNYSTRETPLQKPGQR